MSSDGKYYHLYNRGNNKQNIFFCEDNYIYFLKQFNLHLSPHVDVFAYCLMSNHFHFFIRINDSKGFTKSVKNFFISYVKSINKKYNRVGSLFQGKYQLSEITSDAYYTRIITYIHQNPQVAGIVKNLNEYKYSSYGTYLSNKSSLICREEVIEWFGGINGFISDHRLKSDFRS